MRAIVETAVEATGATGGTLVGREGEVVEVGEPGTRVRAARAPAPRGREQLRHARPLRPRASTRTHRETARPSSATASSRSRTRGSTGSSSGRRSSTGSPGSRTAATAEDALAAELARAVRFGGPLSLVIADLDDFKAVNDRHGHPVGDNVLREFAEVLARTVARHRPRRRAGAARSSCSSSRAPTPTAPRRSPSACGTALAERTSSRRTATKFRVTASFGVASTRRRDGGGADGGRRRGALQAKRAGKNRVDRPEHRRVSATPLTGGSRKLTHRGRKAATLAAPTAPDYGGCMPVRPVAVHAGDSGSPRAQGAQPELERGCRSSGTRPRSVREPPAVQDRGAGSPRGDDGRGRATARPVRSARSAGPAKTHVTGERGRRRPLGPLARLRLGGLTPTAR